MSVQLAERRGAPPKKKAFIRAPSDYSQRLRRAFQLSFFALNVWLGVQFVRFVHPFTGARLVSRLGSSVMRPYPIKGESAGNFTSEQVGAVPCPLWR
jgi:hypothetical protein